MPLFNFLRATSSSAPHSAPAAQPESVEVVRKRAKHRLIGSAVLVLAGVVGFPMLFDTQPRPIAVDIPIEIPGKNTVKPLVIPGRPDVAAALPAPAVVQPQAPVAAAPTPVQEKIAAAASLAPKEEIVSDKKPVPQVIPAPSAIKNEVKTAVKAENKTETKAETKPEPKPEIKVEAKSAVTAADGARAKALLDGQSTAPLASASRSDGGDLRLVVQVGAFADVAKARDARLKLEKAGLKTYTQVAETKDGKRIRVRVGPFASKAEAEQAAGKIRALDLPAAILTL